MWNSSLLASRQERGLLNAFVWFLTKLSKFIKGRVAYLCEVDAVWQPLQSQTSKSPVIIVVFLLQIAKWLAFSEVLPCQKIIDTFENFLLKVPQSKALYYNFTDEMLISLKVNFLVLRSKCRLLKKITVTRVFMVFMQKLWNVHQWDKNKVFI